MERHRAAREAYEKALALAPQLRTALWNLGLLCESQKAFRQAENLYLRLVEYYPEAQDAWFRLGYVQLQLGELPACLKAVEACLSLPKKDPETPFDIGLCHWELRNFGT